MYVMNQRAWLAQLIISDVLSACDDCVFLLVSSYVPKQNE